MDEEEVEIGFTITGTLMVDKKAFEEYKKHTDNYAHEWAIDNLSVNTQEGSCLEYWVEETMEL